MIEVKEQCKGCYHFQVCANILKQQLFIREKLGEENPSCEQFISTADVVEVVRCKDCHFWKGIWLDPIVNQMWGECHQFRDERENYNETEANDYCSYAERREG